MLTEEDPRDEGMRVITVLVPWDGAFDVTETENVQLYSSLTTSGIDWEQDRHSD